MPATRRINLAAVTAKSHPKAVICLFLVRLIDAVQNTGLTLHQRNIKDELTGLWEMFEAEQIDISFLEYFLSREDVKGVMGEMGIAG